MKTIEDLIKFTIKKCKADGTDIDINFLLKYLNSKRDELVEMIKSHRGEDYFNKDVYHDLINRQYKYTGLYGDFDGNKGSNKNPINKISAVYIKYEDELEYKEAKIVGLFNIKGSEEYLAKNQSKSNPIVCLAGKHLYVFPTAQKYTIQNGIRLYGLISLPQLTLETDLKDVWDRRIIGETNILVTALSSIVYELSDNLGFSQMALSMYEKEKEELLSRIGRIKEPLERTLPNEEIDFYSN